MPEWRPDTTATYRLVHNNPQTLLALPLWDLRIILQRQTSIDELCYIASSITLSKQYGAGGLKLRQEEQSRLFFILY